MSRAPDMLRFLGGVMTKHEVGYSGPWPPPERMGLAVGRESGMTSVFDPTDGNLKGPAAAGPAE